MKETLIRGAIGVLVYLWEHIWDFVSAHWGKLLIAIGIILWYLITEHEKLVEAKKEEGKKANLHRTKIPEIFVIESPLTSGKIKNMMSTIRSAVLTVKLIGGGHGSGFIFAHDNWLLTNYHVIESADEYVDLKPENDGQEFIGKIVKTHKERDVALIKLESKFSKRSVLPISYSLPKVGENVYAYGTPLDESLEGTLTRGIVSAIRTMDGMEYIQSDVSVHPGNSGCPLFDEHGNVIGIAVSGRTDDGEMKNLNFFIPIKDAMIKLDLRII